MLVLVRGTWASAVGGRESPTGERDYGTSIDFGREAI